MNTLQNFVRLYRCDEGVTVKAFLTLESGDSGGMVASSHAMKRALSLASRVAQSDAPVLLLGESGSGKERMARFIHEQSQRASKPFIPLNCGALPASLLESELFGHVKGAFTGADRDHEGLFAAADGGTLVLDEIGELPTALQVKLLRVLQDRIVRPVGGTRARAVDVRVVSATHRDLVQMVREGTFREDLYYRLKVVAIETPPLRERREDIVLLAQSFLRRGCKRYRCGPCSMSAEALERLVAYSWPGNVRELEHAMEHAVVLAEGKPHIELADLPSEIRSSDQAQAIGSDILPLAEVERRHILHVLDRCGGSRSQAALTLEIATNTLWRKLREYGVTSGKAEG